MIRPRRRPGSHQLPLLPTELHDLPPLACRSNPSVGWEGSIRPHHLGPITRTHVATCPSYSGSLSSSLVESGKTPRQLASVASFVIPIDHHNPLLGRELDIVLGLASIVVFRRRQDRSASRSRPFRGRLAPTPDFSPYISVGSLSRRIYIWANTIRRARKEPDNDRV
jgi:hypothetical protein